MFHVTYDSTNSIFSHKKKFIITSESELLDFSKGIDFIKPLIKLFLVQTTDTCLMPTITVAQGLRNKEVNGDKFSEFTLLKGTHVLFWLSMTMKAIEGLLLNVKHREICYRRVHDRSDSKLGTVLEFSLKDSVYADYSEFMCNQVKSSFLEQDVNKLSSYLKKRLGTKANIEDFLVFLNYSLQIPIINFRGAKSMEENISNAKKHTVEYNK